MPLDKGIDIGSERDLRKSSRTVFLGLSYDITDIVTKISRNSQILLASVS